MSDSDDEDLKRAIALSLAESNPKTQPTNSVEAVINLISDDEDDDDDLDAPVIARRLSTAMGKSSMAAKTSQALQEVKKETNDKFKESMTSKTSFATESGSLSLKKTPTLINAEKRNSTPNSVLVSAEALGAHFSDLHCLYLRILLRLGL